MSKLSSQVNRLVPRFIIEESPVFAKFIESYLEFIEEYHKVTNPTLPENERVDLKDPYDLISNLVINHDVDFTSKLFLEHYKRIYLSKFLYAGNIDSFAPTGTSTNFRFLIKKIRDFYLSKGSINSIQFFFRSIYGVSVDVYIPKVDILRASDGDWFEPIVIRPDKAILTDVMGNETEILIEKRLSQVLGLSEWQSTKSYSEGTRIWHEQNIWISLQSLNVNNEPISGSTYWAIYSPTRTDWLELFPLRDELRSINGSGFIKDIRQPKLKAWSAAGNYKLKSLVNHNNKNWIAIDQPSNDQETPNIDEPGNAPTIWEEITLPFYLELDNTTGTLLQGARVNLLDPLLTDSASLEQSESDLILSTFELGLPIVDTEWSKFEEDSNFVLKDYVAEDRVSLNLVNYNLDPGVSEPYHLAPEEDPKTFEVITKNGLTTELDEDPVTVDVSINAGDNTPQVMENINTATPSARPKHTDSDDGKEYAYILLVETSDIPTEELKDNITARVPSGIEFKVIDTDVGSGNAFAIGFTGVYEAGPGDSLSASPEPDESWWLREPDRAFNNVLEEPGLWLNRDGFLSDEKVLQDNDVFQDFSYQIETPLNRSRYLKNFIDNVHPIGLKLITKRSAGPPTEIAGFDINVKVLSDQPIWVIDWELTQGAVRPWPDYVTEPDPFEPFIPFPNSDTDHTGEVSNSFRTKWHNVTTVPKVTIDYTYVERTLVSNPNFNLWITSPRVGLVNYNFEQGSTGWTVTNEDTSKIATFNGTTLRLQADTLSPELTVAQTEPPLVENQWYEIVTNCSAWTGGAAKITGIGGDVIIADSVGITSRLIQALDSDLAIKVAGTTPIDLEIDSITAKAIQTGPNQVVKFISDFLLYGGYNHTLAFNRTANGFRKISSSDDRFAISNQKVYYTDVDEVGHAIERQNEFGDLIFFHLFPRRRTSYIEDLVQGVNYSVGAVNTTINFTINNDVIHHPESLTKDDVLVFINGQLAPKTDDFTFTSITGGFEFKLIKEKIAFENFYGSTFETIELVFLDANNSVERLTVTVPGATEMEINEIPSRHRLNYLVFFEGFVIEDDIEHRQYKNLMIRNNDLAARTYEIVLFNELSNNVINRIEKINPIFNDYMLDSIAHVTEISAGNTLQQHTTAPSYTRVSPSIIDNA